MKVEINLGETVQPNGVGKTIPALLDLEELLATRLLVQGNSGSGKSHLLRRLLEQSANWVQQCVIDPEGDFVSLADQFNHLIVDARRSEQELTRIAARVRQHRVSVVLNLEELETERQMRAAAAFLGGLFDAEREYWYPLLVIVDEAQLFAPAAAGDVADDARKIALGAMTNLMCRGRKRGLAGVVATQRLAKLAKNVAAEASNFLMGRTFLDIDMLRAADLIGMERRQAEMFRELDRGHFIALGPALTRKPTAVAIGDVATAARSASPKLTPLPSAARDTGELIFKAALNEQIKRVEPPILKPVEEILAANIRDERVQTEVASSGPDDEELDRQLQEIIREIITDPEATYRTIAVLYQDFLVRCRIKRVSTSLPDLKQFRRRLALAQAAIDTMNAQDERWQKILDRSQTLEEDLQGVFLALAKIALTHEPCLSDATLARLYGTHSLSRARRLLNYFEERGLIVIRNDFFGKRIVVFPEIDCETAPGDPNGADVLRVVEE